LTAALAAAPWILLRAPGSTGPTALPALWHFYVGRPRTLVLDFSRPTDVAVGDVIYLPLGDPRQPSGLRRVGEVQALWASGRPQEASRADVAQASALIYPSAPALGALPALVYHTKPDTFVWVIDALFTPERRASMLVDLQQALEAHRAEIVAAFQPLIESSLGDLRDVLEQDLPPAIERHRPEFEALAAKYRREILDQQLLPLVKSDVLPIVRQQTEPVLREVGEELWQHVSLWRFGWRFAYDLSPLPEKNLMDREWNRFVQEDALPTLEKHSDQFVDLIKNILRDVSRDPRLQAAVRGSLETIAGDPQVRQLGRALFDEVVVHNPHFRQAIERRLADPQTRQAIELAAGRLEPTLRRIGDQVLGTQASGITPEFARVLRTEILDKDERWFVLLPGEGNPEPNSAAGTPHVRVQDARHD
ncbi:MAG TPA: hypothetical protein VHY20_08440, partial [Pirellulales bacterium]|nr:hypothetical protein [Pirellulales bacterium]